MAVEIMNHNFENKKSFGCASLINGLIWGLVLGVNASLLSVTSGVFGAFLGAVLGALFLSYCLAHSRLRIPVFVVGSILLNRLLIWMANLPVNSAFIASLFSSPEDASAISQGLVWFFNCLLLVGTIHAISLRKSWFVAFELIIVANIALFPLAAHRNGFISRPYFFVDPLWSEGHDPVPYFVGVGMLLAIALVFLIVGKLNRRSIVNLSILVVIITLVGIFLPLKELRNPLPKQIIGGEAKGEDQEKSKGKKGNNQKPKDKNDKGDNSQDKDDKNQDKNDKNQDKEGESGSGSDSDKDNSEKGEKSDNNEDNDRNINDPPPDQPVAVVLLNDDCKPYGGNYYFRQEVKSFFNGKKLLQDVSGRYDHDVASGFPQPNGSNVITAPRFNPSITKSVGTKVCLITDHNKPFGLVNPYEMSTAPNPNSGQFIGAYNVKSRSFTGKLPDLMKLHVGNPNWSKADIEYYTQIPKDPRYKELADKIVKELPAQYKDSSIAKIFMIQLWLSKNCIYDASVRVKDKEDVTAKFLFGDRIGYCVHFSSAMAYLGRSLGIPTRVAEGYAVEEKNTYGGSSLLIMGSYAHSWCEIYLDGLGWFPIDVYAERSRSPQQDPPDPDLQKMLGEMAREESSNEDGVPQKPVDVQKQLQVLVKMLGYGLVLVLIAAFIYAWIYKIYLHTRVYFCLQASKVDYTYKAALVSLAELGIRRRYGETREEFALRWKEQLPSLEELTAGHLRRSFGATKDFQSYLPLPESSTVSSLYRDLKSQMQGLAPWWRRWLGILNPFAWIFVH